MVILIRFLRQELDRLLLRRITESFQSSNSRLEQASKQEEVIVRNAIFELLGGSADSGVDSEVEMT